MRVEGSCHCGHVTYEAEVDPNSAHICNCADCQMLTGSAFRVTVHAPKATFRLLGGQPKVYVKTADSGAKRRHSFCPDCGTPVHSTADTDDPPAYSLRVGCLKQRAQLPAAETQLVQVRAGMGARRERLARERHAVIPGATRRLILAAHNGHDAVKQSIVRKAGTDTKLRLNPKEHE